MRNGYLRFALMAAAGSMTAGAASAWADSQWQGGDREWRSQSRAQGDYRSEYSRPGPSVYDDRYTRGRSADERRWRDSRSDDAWRFERPYSARERDRLSWSEYDRPERGRDMRSRGDMRDMPHQRAGRSDESIPSYPRDFYAGRGPDQYQGRQYMPPGFDYYDFYGAERPSNRPDYRSSRSYDRRMSDARQDDGRMRAMRERDDAAMADSERYWREDYRRWARGQSDLYDGRYQLPDYDGDFTGSTGVGMGDMTGRGVGLPDYYQGERGGGYHRNPEQWARIMKAQRAAEKAFREEMAQSAEQPQQSSRRGAPPMARAVAGSDRDEESAANQPDIPGQSQAAVGHPRQAQTTGQGQGVIETNTDAVKQPDTQIPEQSLGTVGHPGARKTTGQGAGVAEQPAGDNATTR